MVLLELCKLFVFETGSRVVQADLELLIFHLSDAGIITVYKVCHHAWFYSVLKVEFMAWYTLGNCSTSPSGKSLLKDERVAVTASGFGQTFVT